jgi:hypothetical protein
MAAEDGLKMRKIKKKSAGRALRSKHGLRRADNQEIGAERARASEAQGVR